MGDMASLIFEVSLIRRFKSCRPKARQVEKDKERTIQCLLNQITFWQLTPSNGGIAQLVERQLCKLDVRGSNPLASTPLARGE